MYHPGLIFVQKAFLLGLFSGEIIFGEAYYWKEQDIFMMASFTTDNYQNPSVFFFLMLIRAIVI